MKFGRILIAGVVVSIFNAVVSAVTCGGIFNWVYHLEPTNVWKPMDGPPGAAFIKTKIIAETTSITKNSEMIRRVMYPVMTPRG